MAFGNPIELQLWDRNFSYVGTVGNIQKLDFTLRFNDVSQGEVQVIATNPYAGDLALPGMRYKLFYKGELQSTGRVTVRKAEGLSREATLTCTLTDDFVILQEVVAWPYPTGTKTQQHNAEHDKYSGKAEGAVRHYLRRNAVDRLGMPLTVGTANVLGGNIKLNARAVTLFDLYEPIFARRDMGVRLVHRSGTSITVECYSPTLYPLALREDSNHIQAFTYEHKDPAGTRAFIGGSNEKRDRIFETSVNSALEGDYGTIREIFVDARDLGDDYRQAQNDRDSKYETLKERKKEWEAANAKYYASAVKADAAQDAFDNADSAYDAALAYKDYIYERSDSTTTQKNRANSALTKASGRRSSAQSKLNSANSTNSSDAAALLNAANARDTAQTQYNTAVALVATTLAAHRVELQERGAEKLAEVQPSYGFSVVLGEALNFSYGPDGVKLGDRVTINAGTVQLTDVLSEVQLVWSAENGMVVTPKTGEIADTYEKTIAKAIGTAFKNIRRISAR